MAELSVTVTGNELPGEMLPLPALTVKATGVSAAGGGGWGGGLLPPPFLQDANNIVTNTVVMKNLFFMLNSRFINEE
jgi:hypothetical protein